MTAFGLMRAITAEAWRTPRQMVRKDFASAIGFFEPKVADATWCTSAAGKWPAKRPARSSVAGWTCQPRATSSCASASAGKRCPPVPPAESRIVRSAILFRRDDAARHALEGERLALFRPPARQREHHAHGDRNR